MLANTLTFNVYGVSRTFTRMREIGTSSIYKFRDTNAVFQLTVKQTNFIDKARNVPVLRSAAELSVTLNPVAPGAAPEVRKAYFVTDRDVNTSPAHAEEHLDSLVSIMSDKGFQTALVGEEY